MEPLAIIREQKIVAIIRGAAPADVLEIARALLEGGIRVMEITLNSPDALKAIVQVSKHLGKDVLTGAGTVLTAKEAESAIGAGARFIISPSLHPEVIHAAKKHEVVSIPGAFTPTEIVTAFREGGDIIKVFPASVGANYIRDIRGPLPYIPLMPTGGVHLANIMEFLQTGAVAAGIGSALVDTRQPVTKEYLDQLVKKARQFVEIVSTIKDQNK